jgi:hypothetical protein
MVQRIMLFATQINQFIIPTPGVRVHNAQTLLLPGYGQ